MAEIEKQNFDTTWNILANLQVKNLADLKKMEEGFNKVTKSAALLSAGYHKLKDSYSQVMSKANMVFGLIGASAGIFKGIGIADTYNRSILQLSSSFGIYGKSIREVETFITRISDKMKMAPSIIMDMASAYQKGFNIADMRDFEQLTANIKNVVGADKEAMMSMMGVIQEVTNEFPLWREQLVYINRLTAQEKSDLEATLTAELQVNSAFFDRYKVLMAYSKQNEQILGRDKERVSEAQKQIEAVEALKKVAEEISRQLGQIVLEFLPKISDFLLEINKHLREVFNGIRIGLKEASYMTEYIIENAGKILSYFTKTTIEISSMVVSLTPLKNILEIIDTIFTKIVGKVEKITFFIPVVTSVLKKIIDKSGVNIGSSLGKDITKEIEDTFKNTFNGLGNKYKDFKEKAENIGKDYKAFKNEKLIKDEKTGELPKIPPQYAMINQTIYENTKKTMQAEKEKIAVLTEALNIEIERQQLSTSPEKTKVEAKLLETIKSIKTQEDDIAKLIKDRKDSIERLKLVKNQELVRRQMLGLEKEINEYEKQQNAFMKQRTELQIKATETQRGLLELRSTEVSLIEAQNALAENYMTGVAASVQMRKDLVVAIQKELDVATKIADEKRVVANLDKGNIDKQKAATEAEQKKLELMNKQATALKNIRDQWASALTAMTIGTGRITKMQITSDKNMRQGIQYMQMVKSSVSGATSGGFTSPTSFGIGPGGALNMMGGMNMGAAYSTPNSAFAGGFNANEIMMKNRAYVQSLVSSPTAGASYGAGSAGWGISTAGTVGTGQTGTVNPMTGGGGKGATLILNIGSINDIKKVAETVQTTVENFARGVSGRGN